MSDLAYNKRDRVLIIPFPNLILMVGFFVGAAFLLVPKEEELLNRFIEDKNAERAQDLFNYVIGRKDDADLAQLRAAQSGAVEPAGPDSPDPVVTLETFLCEEACRPGGVSIPDLVFAVRSAETPEAGLVLEQLRLAGADETLAGEDWRTLAAAVAEKALAEGDPALAADLLLEACSGEEAENGGWDRVRLAVQSCRWAGRPEDAADLLSQFEPADMTEEMMRLRVSVLQELGRNAEALTVITGYISTLGGEVPVPDSLMGSAEQTGIFSGQQSELIPLYRRHLAATEIGQMPWEEFLEAADGGRLRDTESYTRYAKKFAQFCEWNALPSESFDHYAKLAVMGDWEATLRCIDLHLGLARQIDLEEILSRNPGPPSGGVPGIKRLHLTLIGGNGNYEAAVVAYRNWIAKNPGDADAWMELALVFDEMGDIAQSLNTCEEAIEIHPQHRGIRTQTARLMQSVGRYEEALAILRDFTPEEHDAITREDYELLSEALGEWDDFDKAVRLTFAATPEPSVEQYESLARCGELARDPEAEIAALKDGLAAHPGSRILSMNLASLLYDMGKFEDAIAVLTQGDILNYLPAVCLLIDVGGHLANPETVIGYLGEDAHERFKLPTENLLVLSDIYQKTGRVESAAQIYEKMPMGPPRWEMMAALRYNQRRLDEAKHYQELLTERSTDHAAWLFLGEILQEMGDAPGAERAFKKSLSLLRSRIVSENRSVARR